jgi:IMP dehydrogenase
MTTNLTGLTFDDVQIIPQYSDIESRSAVVTSAHFTKNFVLPIPLVGAPMDTVCGPGMVNTLARLGGVGCLHRFMTVEEHIKQIEFLFPMPLHPVVGTIGATGDWQARLHALLDAHVNTILIDVAHGDHIHVKRAMTYINKLTNRSNFDVILGNIATAEAARRLESWGADALRVGIGGGSMCETRIRTGVGVPQLQAIADVVSAANVPVIADGGIRTPGDVCKALAAGADTVMLGSMFACTYEAPGEMVMVDGKWEKPFRGSASASQKASNKADIRYVEGAETKVVIRGSVETVVREIMDGVRSCMSYVGVSNLDQLAYNAEFVSITSAGLNEAHPHGVLK